MSAVASTTSEIGLSDAERGALKRRFGVMIAVTLACCVAALLGMMAHVSMHQAWGMPLFILAMVAGFGGQIAFIVGLARSSRPEKGV